MHWPAFAGSQRRSRTTRGCRARTLKNWLAWHRTTRHRTRRGCRGRRGRTDRCLIHRTRSCLRHDHARSRRPLCNRCGWRKGSCGLRRNRRWSLSRRRYRSRRRWSRRSYRHRWWRHHRTRRNRYRRRLGRRRHHVHRSNRRLRQNDPRRRRLDFRRSWRRRSYWSFGDRCGRFSLYRMCYGRPYGRRRRWRRLLTDDRLQHISGLGDMGQVNLGLDFVGLSARAMTWFGGCRGFTGAAQLGAHLVGFVLFQRTGMGLLFRDPNFRKHVKNRFALDFQFSG